MNVCCGRKQTEAVPGRGSPVGRDVNFTGLFHHEIQIQLCRCSKSLEAALTDDEVQIRQHSQDNLWCGLDALAATTLAMISDIAFSSAGDAWQLVTDMLMMKVTCRVAGSVD